MNMQMLLKTQVGKEIQIYAETYTSSQSALEKVYRENFIRMDGVNYVPQAANEIYMLEKTVPSDSPSVRVRTLYESSSFTALYLGRGSDYVELARSRESGTQIAAFIIPMHKLIGLQFID